MSQTSSRDPSSTSIGGASWMDRSASELARLIAAGDLSASEVVEAHIARIEAVNDRLNAVVQTRFDEARREAERVDADRLEGKPLGPLAGVPITIKECFHVQGMTATIGVQGLGNGQKAERDGVLVAKLRAAGAVVLGKTNVPQLMAMIETDNPVYGRANNPWDLQRSPGGSSGGEAAIIAAGGSMLGLGNDLGGSIRMPSHACGIHGLKPTARRLTNLGAVLNFRGLDTMPTQPGPLARHVADLELAYRILARPGIEHSEDPNLSPPEHDKATGATQEVLEGLRGGYWEDDGYFSPCPAARRAVREAVEALKAAGVEMQPIEPPSGRETMRLFMALLTADGGADLRRLLGTSRRDHRIARTLMLLRIPRAIRLPIAVMLEQLGQPREAGLLRSAGPYSADAHWRHSHEKNEFAQAFGRRMVHDRLDFVVCPTFPLPALRHGAAGDLAVAGSYCMLFNLLGMPAGTVSITRVRPDEQNSERAGRAPSDQRAREAEADSAGLPMSVQIAAPWWKEHRVLAVMRALEEAFRSRPDFPSEPPISGRAPS